MTQPQLWIKRKKADEIYADILAQKVAEENGVNIFYIKAPGGAGKTFLARDLGTRLGSPGGYKPGNRQGIFWSGILDLYDPDTNNNRGIEQLLIRAFADHPNVDFKDYFEQRAVYVKLSQGGTGGPPLEEQRKKVEEMFSKEICGIAGEKLLVWVFDTVERIQSAQDPTEARLGELGEPEDTASVMGWLLFQISRLPKATILLFGRPEEKFENRLRLVIDKIDRPRSLKAIQFKVIDLSTLSDEEVQDFFAFQQEKHPQLAKILSSDVKDLLSSSTGSNPLLLGIALQTILETGRLNEVRVALKKKDNMSEVGKKLIRAYMNPNKPEQKALLEYLALARNGLFPELLKLLKRKDEDLTSLQKKLEEMANLPFVKTRHIFTGLQDSLSGRPTYFLHDAMYEICDAALLLPVPASQASEKIVAWYEKEIDRWVSQLQDAQFSRDQVGERRDDPVTDLLVESLFYRLRANPQIGYIWYLRESEAAFRSVRPGYEMRLADSMAQFAVNVDPDPEKKSSSARSVIDEANIERLMPDLWDQFSIDSAMMWVRRLSFRARHKEAIWVAENATWAEETFNTNPKKYSLSFSELKIWQAQSLMYLGRVKEAAKIYQGNLDRLKNYTLEHLRANKKKYSEAELKRICFIKGRTLNNLGYTSWMYFGQYSSALSQLLQAIEYFKEAGLTEEEATSLDNIGRIHAVLWDQHAAKRKIREGLEKRESEGEKARYRLALSLISLASMQHRFGNFQLALDNVNRAYDLFNTMEVKRGRGLAYLTRAMIYRSMAEARDENRLSLEQAVAHTNLAIEDLANAIRIFRESVQETIRSVFALNEMGSCYRCLYMLRAAGNADEEERLSILENGVDYYNQAITNARKYDYFIEELDSRQDLAVLYARARQYENAASELDITENKIPSTYKIKPGSGLEALPEADTVDAYYKLMGQIELLRGAMIFDQMKGQTASMEQVLKATEHYVLGVAYYYRFSGIYSNTYISAIDRISRRLERCDKSINAAIKNIHLKQWIEKYKIPAEWVQPVFDKIFKMLGI
jgi:tetratricopeptide (TPR) repeat protein